MEYVKNFKKSDEGGVLAVASTTCSLKVLLEFLTSQTVKIPVRALDVGTITPVEIRKAYKMSEEDVKQRQTTILAFEVDVTPEASQLAERLEVKVICGCVLETLLQQFKEETKMDDDDDEEEAIFPCVLRILPDLVFNKEDPVVLGVLVVRGFLKVGTPICSLASGCPEIGRVVWIGKDQRTVEDARLGEMVIIKIEQGRSLGSHHLDIKDDILVSRISRRSINALKASYRDALSMSDWKLVRDLKSLFNII
ncbi:hypothetical protein EUTSA_v10021382mg [Eutrema salsugineum]|uniref:Uncharacterized protein n=2 Tax=Eutrema salsugineum TaxID=72664 RepID=V4M6I2_EUTSA|nr:hypothetical protein EUTSA_v10021382mg [Eutrema salsugineum]